MTIETKLNLLELGAYLGNVFEACRTQGYSRDTFYRLKKKYDEGGIEALQELSSRKPNPENRVEKKVECAIVELATELAAHGQVRIATELAKRVMTISPARVWCVWWSASQKHDNILS